MRLTPSAGGAGKHDPPPAGYPVLRFCRRPAVVVGCRRLQSCDPEELSAASVQLVQVHPGEAVKLHQGTWHAGPFFHAPSALFYNLELGDTNLTDHNSHALTAPISLKLD